MVKTHSNLRHKKYIFFLLFGTKILIYSRLFWYLLSFESFPPFHYDTSMVPKAHQPAPLHALYLSTASLSYLTILRSPQPQADSAAQATRLLD